MEFLSWVVIISVVIGLFVSFAPIFNSHNQAQASKALFLVGACVVVGFVAASILSLLVLLN